MRRLLIYSFCSVCMVGVYFGVKFLATGISPDFGLGAFVGYMLCAGLFWLSGRAGHSNY